MVDPALRPPGLFLAIFSAVTQFDVCAVGWYNCRMEFWEGQLYDLSTDIGETQNLSREKPEIAKMLQDRFRAWRTEGDASDPRGPFRDY